jgi:hypothetical protein
MADHRTLEDGDMQTAESHCKYCEKFVLDLESHKEIDMLLELPNTYDHTVKTYKWRDTGFMAYALFPRSIHGTHGLVDVYVCVDEDDIDDIDLSVYIRKFLTQEILPSQGNVKNMNLSGPFLSPPPDIGCWRLRHEGGGVTGR